MKATSKMDGQTANSMLSRKHRFSRCTRNLISELQYVTF